MDKIELYLSIVPLPVLLGVGMLAAILVVIVPKRLLLPMSLVVLPAWHDLGRMPELGTIAAVAKVTSLGAFLLVLVAALLYPGRRRRLPGIVWVYPAVGLIGMPFLMGVTDRNFALALQLQWTFLSLAAIAVVRCITSIDELRRLLMYFGVGCAFALMLPFSSILLNPRSVSWRFFPWGANPNQIGVLFLMATPLSLLMATWFRGMVRKTFFLLAASAGGLMAVLSASRSTIFPLVPLCLIIVAPLVKRPSVLVIGGLVILLSAGWMGTLVQNTKLSRVQTLGSERGIRLVRFMETEVLPRAGTGLLGTSGESSRVVGEIGASHAHNAYVEQMYMFGMLVGGMSVVMAVYTLWCTYKTFLHRHYVFRSPSLGVLLAAFMGVVYLHGFANSSIYYPTYSWAWFHVMLSCLFIGIWNDLRRGGDGFGNPFQHHTDAYGSAESEADWYTDRAAYSY